jgi:hypothetical protein
MNSVFQNTPKQTTDILHCNAVFCMEIMEGKFHILVHLSLLESDLRRIFDCVVSTGQGRS